VTSPATAQSLPTVAELAEASARLEGAHPVEIVRCAVQRMGVGGQVPSNILVTSSFQDAVLAHVVTQAVPGIEVVLLDTGYLFAETLWYAEHLRERFGINARIDKRDETRIERDVWRTDTDACCAARKVVPLEDALRDKDVWITGLRRDDATTRANTPIISRDELRGVIKVNPLAALSNEDVSLYESLYELPDHPLRVHGYTSIGCWPCTRPTLPGEDPRAGRWSGSGKTECGLHTPIKTM
jgi:phosphoadenosine phosphosulfate reductase